MLRLIAYGLIVTPIAYGALWLADNPGDVTMHWFGYQITTSLALLIGMMGCVMVALAALVMIIHSIFSVPTKLKHRHVIKRQDQGITALTRAMAALAISDQRDAAKHIEKAKHYLGDNAPAPLLLSAQLSHLKGESAATSGHFRAMLERPETRLVGLRGMIELAMREQRTEDAIRYAREAWKAQPNDRWLGLKLLDLLTRDEAWVDALDVIKVTEKKRALGSDEARRYDAIIQFERSRRADAHGTFDKALDLAKLSVKRDKSFKPAQLLAADILAKKDDKKALYKWIAQQWKTAPHARYITLLSRAFADEAPNKFYKRIEKLVASNTDHLESQLAMARVAIDQSKWDVARNHLKVALTTQESPRVYEMLAEVEKAEEGNDKQAAEWLRRALSAPKDAAWHCTQCTHIDRQWHLHCPECGSFDSAVWHGFDTPAGETEALLAG